MLLVKIFSLSPLKQLGRGEDEISPSYSKFFNHTQYGVISLSGACISDILTFLQHYYEHTVLQSENLLLLHLP